jgi:membrane fusion protein, multidrug efflux system
MRPSLRPVPVVVLALAAVFAGCSRKTAGGTAAGGAAPARPPQPVEVAAVERRDLAETLSLVGSLAANESAQIRAEISGQIRAVNFEEGHAVRRGDVLVRIDDSELRAQLAQAESRFRLAELNLKRSEDLAQARSMSQAELDRTRSEFSSAEAELRLLRVRVDKMEIKAPFDGIIGSRTISPGDYVTAATSITTLNDLSRLKIDFQVPELFTSKVRPGSTFTVRARTPAGEVNAPGEVYFVASVIERATRSSQVKGLLGPGLSGLKPGMFANVEIVLQVRSGALTVPEGAVLVTPRGPQIVAVRTQGADAVADFVPVTLGLRERGLVEVTPVAAGALTEGQSVVASGVGGLVLFPGAKLAPRPLRAEFRVGG